MSWLQGNIGRARAVLIAPSIAKAGFIFGGSGGRAVLLARDPATGKWAGPVFYTMATASVGFQAGVSVSENVTLVMTEKALNSLMSNSVKAGADASVAAGPVGAGAKSDVVADLVTFSRAKGVYGGLNLDGTVIAVSNDWNKAYFGKDVLPPDVLIRHDRAQQAGRSAAGPGDQGHQEVAVLPFAFPDKGSRGGPFLLGGMAAHSPATARRIPLEWRYWQNGHAFRA